MQRFLICSIVFLLCNTTVSAQQLYLSGTGSDDTKTWDFYCSAGQNSNKWRKIQVPSCWELQGYGEYTYGRFYKKKGVQPSNETGHYRTTFRVPKAWNGKYLRLTFEGVMTDARVLIDGKQISNIHQGGFTEFSYDVTPFVIPGKAHKLEVFVSKESSNKSVNSAERRADWWLFGGIYRPVYIDAMPKNHIEHVAIDARANGDLYAKIDKVGNGEVLFSLDGKEIPFDEEARCYHCGNVTTWDPEHPNLHNAVFTLKESGHSVSQRIGFRTIEFRKHDGIYLNGTKLIVKGVNRHCFHPETGRTTSKALSIEDARLIKQMNMNAVRCHYPSDRHFLDVCDSVGLLYLDEFPGWQTKYDDETVRRLMPEFVLRDVNHPCVFMWSNGNEGGWNVTADSLFAKYDLQQRKVIHPWSDFEGLDTHHYPAYQTGAYRMHNGQNVFMPTEFLHSKYDKGGGAALEDMWNHWMKSPLFAGGFIWAYIDEAVRRTDLGGLLDSDGGNGPDGIVNAYRQPEGSFYTIREVWSPVYIDKIHVTPSFNGKILVENHFLFTNLSECRMTYRTKTSCGKVIDEGPVRLSPTAPGESAYASFAVPKDFWQADILELSAYRGNDELCQWSAPIHRAEEQLDINLSDAVEVKRDEAPEVFPVGMSKIDDLHWYRLTDGRLYLDAHILYNERTASLTDESKWQIGVSITYPESSVDSVRWLGNGPFRVWRNRLKGQQFGTWSLAYNNTITGQYNTTQPPLYPEFKGYRSNMRWLEILNRGKLQLKVTSLTEGLYFRLFTPEEAVDETPGEMGGMDEGKKKQERTMVKFPAGDISFLLSIPPMQSYKPLEQLGPGATPDNIRIKSGDEGFHIRLVFDQR